jgi:hypothetical protein
MFLTISEVKNTFKSTIMRKILLLLFICINVVTHSQTTADLDEKNGYKGIKLGMTLDSLKNIYKIKEEKKFDDSLSNGYLINEKTILKFGDYDLSRVTALNYKKKNKIYMIVLEMPNVASRGKYDLLYNFFKVLYGDAQNSNDAGAVWEGFKTKMTMIYDYLSNNVTIYIQDNEITKEMEKDLNNRIKQQGKDF